MPTSARSAERSRVCEHDNIVDDMLLLPAGRRARSTPTSTIDSPSPAAHGPRCAIVARIVAFASALTIVHSCELNPAFDEPITATGDGDPPTAGGEPDVDVRDLASLWTTPNQIRWQWVPDGSEDTLFGYELVTGPTEADVRERSSACRTWTHADNPELGHYLLGGADWISPVSATTTDGFAPETVQYAQLHAIDTQGRVASSNIAAARTQAEVVSEVIIFRDEPPPWQLPAELAFVDDMPYQGTLHGQWTAPATEWVNLRWMELGLDLTAITSGPFASTAHLQVALAVETDGSPPWSELSLWFQAASGETDCCNTYYSGWVPRTDGAYHVMQVPLRVFELSDADGGGSATWPLVHTGLYQFGVGAQWAANTRVRVDEVSIRW